MTIMTTLEAMTYYRELAQESETWPIRMKYPPGASYRSWCRQCGVGENLQHNIPHASDCILALAEREYERLLKEVTDAGLWGIR